MENQNQCLPDQLSSNGHIDMEKTNSGLNGHSERKRKRDCVPSTFSIFICTKSKPVEEATEVQVSALTVLGMIQQTCSVIGLSNDTVKYVSLDSKRLQPREVLAEIDFSEKSTFIFHSIYDEEEEEEEESGSGATPDVKSKKPVKVPPPQLTPFGILNPAGTSAFVTSEPVTPESMVVEEQPKKKKKKVFGVDKNGTKLFRIVPGPSEQLTIELLDYNLINTLQQELQSDALYQRKPRMTAWELFAYLPRFKELTEPSKDDDEEKEVMIHDQQYLGLDVLVEWLDEVFKEKNEKLEEMLSKGVISFEGLGAIFSRNKKVYSTDPVMGEKVGMIVTKSDYKKTFCGVYFYLEASVLKTDGKEFVRVNEGHAIEHFKGVKSILSLPVKPLTPEVAEELSERGRLFHQYAIGNHYLYLKGCMIERSWRSFQFKADGRVMVDGISYNKFNPNAVGNFNYSYNSRGEQEKLKVIPESDLWNTWPFLSGFSFVAKQWGEIPISNLSPIVFDDSAFDKLVLPIQKKKLIRALVDHQDKTFSDIISGKGGGCIFLLHGSPGTGKTLTAESIAELLHRPLYSITAGELGTNTSALETSLKDILELASTWKAVILLDEADIFLEKRADEDIKRNAMVGIFLRLLEYHQGVLFLTTNRVKNFDPAFHSRISVALSYSDLDDSTRECIWKNLLEAAGIKTVNASDFKSFPLNGRQIKNSIRLSMGLAASENSPVTKELLLETINVSQQFQKDLLSLTSTSS